MNNGIVTTAVGVNRIDGFHTAVETQNEIIQIKPQTQAVRRRNLFVKTIETELSALLVGIIACSPYIAAIYKDSAMQFPE